MEDDYAFTMQLWTLGSMVLGFTLGKISKILQQRKQKGGERSVNNSHK